MARPLSRTKRWAQGLEEAREGYEKLKAGLETLSELRSEYEEWQGNLPENLQSGALAEKLDAIVELEFDSLTDEVETMLDNAEGCELPLGFGRD